MGIYICKQLDMVYVTRSWLKRIPIYAQLLNFCVALLIKMFILFLSNAYLTSLYAYSISREIYVDINQM